MAPASKHSRVSSAPPAERFQNGSLKPEEWLQCVHMRVPRKKHPNNRQLQEVQRKTGCDPKSKEAHSKKPLCARHDTTQSVRSLLLLRTTADHRKYELRAYAHTGRHRSAGGCKHQHSFQLQQCLQVTHSPCMLSYVSSRRAHA
jgi:hypothetical protein